MVSSVCTRYVSFFYCNTPPTCNHHNRHSIFFLDVALYSGVTQVGIRNSLRSNNHISVSTITYSPTSGEFALHQVKNMVMKRDKANTTLLMAAAESGSKATFEASLDAAKNHASGEVFVHMI